MISWNTDDVIFKFDIFRSVLRETKGGELSIVLSHWVFGGTAGHLGVIPTLVHLEIEIWKLEAYIPEICIA